jgi:hypothetical protein
LAPEHLGLQAFEEGFDSRIEAPIFVKHLPRLFPGDTGE